MSTEFKLSVFQRAVLLYMFLEQRRLGDTDVTVRFSRPAIELAMWFTWQGYHTGAMRKLEALGWIEEVGASSIVYYQLTRAARQYYGQWVGAAALELSLHPDITGSIGSTGLTRDLT